MKAKLTLLIVLISIQLNAQQEIITTTFWNNYSHINPAMSALEYQKHGSFVYRKDRAGLAGDFTSILTNANFKLANKHGLGINYSHKDDFYLKVNDVKINYNYQFQFEKGRSLSIGAGLGLITNKVDDEYLEALLFGDSTINYAGKVNFFSPDIGLAYNSGKFMFGAGVLNLLEGEVSNKRDDEVLTSSPERMYYFNGHYKIKLGKKKNLEIRPQFILRTDLAFTNLDLNALATYKNKYWVGFTYRNTNALAFMLGWDIKEKIRVGYSYDLVKSKLTSSSSASHEIGIGLFLK